MTDFKTLVQQRRSHRKFTSEEISPEAVRLILRSALMSPTSKSLRKWHFIVVDDKTDIEKIADAKDLGSQFLKGAPLVVVVTGSATENDCWVEDASIAAVTMQYQAQDLGLGSCWAQMWKRGLSDGTTAEEVIHGVLDIPEDQHVLCALGFGHPADERQPQNEERLKWEQVHIGKYKSSQE